MEFLAKLNNQEHNVLEDAVFDYLQTELEENILKYSKKDFEKYLCDTITEFYYDAWCDAELIDDDEDTYDELYVHFNIIILCFFEINEIFPPRSSCQYERICDQEQHNEITKQIELLKSIDQPKQKTDEWYTYRHNMLTASNIWKVFGSEANINSIIYEKCQPLNSNQVHSHSLVWGNMFEPVSIDFYETYYKTKIDDFGCILHPTLHMIGASPDGINVDPNHPKYGTMLEIKNIVNRDIDGIPKEEYWIQMQIQLETCNLEYCDFLETRFKTYESIEDFYHSTHEYKSVILEFQSPEKQTEYIYVPLQCENKGAFILESMKKKQDENYKHVRNLYYYLDEFSCVVVHRNRKWFHEAKDYIENCWKTILHEREHGYEHRKPKQQKSMFSKKVFVTLQNDTQVIHNLPTSPNNIIKLG